MNKKYQCVPAVSNKKYQIRASQVSVRQLKAARALLGWSQQDLARESNVSQPTIARIESGDGVLSGRPATAEKIRAALEENGIEFTNGSSPGVRLRARRV
jgi:transcriptional regulator with XRE-family HTH domain